MVVVIVVSVLAALAIPSMIRARDDRHAYNNSMQVAQILRGARLRAIGRGGAVAVMMTASGAADRGTFRVFEAVTANATTNGSAPTSDTTNRTPIASCLTPSWDPASPPPTSNALPLDALDYNLNLDVTLDFQSSIDVAYVDRTGNPAGGSGVSIAWVCFTPAGRTYVSTGSAIPAFAVGNTFIDVDVCMRRGGGCTSGIGLKRHVLVPPAGVARLYSN